MKKYLLCLLLSNVVVWGAVASEAGPQAIAVAGPVTVFVARKIITMEPALPEATAVAVAEGRIVGVGSPASLQPWIERHGGTVDRRFEDKILLPGFIDPHVHPSLPAVVTQFPFLAPDDWHLPTGHFPGATTPAQYEKQLKALVSAHFQNEARDPAAPFIAWGYHQLWHGEVFRPQLNEWFPDQPVMLWHRSFHELIGNDAAFELLGVTQADFGENPETDWAKGHVWENGAVTLLPKMAFLMAPQRYIGGLQNFLGMIHQGGVTTVLDMGVGVFGNVEAETAMIRRVFERDDAPARVILTPIITRFLAAGQSPAEAEALIEGWTEASSDHVLFDNHFKLMMDGAIYSGLSQFDYPGYLDGHEGQWMAPLEVTYQWAEHFWNAGYQLHAHTNGDLSARALIDIVRRLQQQHPRVDHRTTLEHFAYATADQVAQMKALGMLISANPYYQYILADVYADQWLGEDRARAMVPLRLAADAGIPIGLHSDAPMAPLAPLTLAASAVVRQTIDGNQNAPGLSLTVDQALRAITIEAAWILRWEDRIGSIRAGKYADFTVLERDPYTVKPVDIPQIPIWGTVFEGRVFPLSD